MKIVSALVSILSIFASCTSSSSKETEYQQTFKKQWQLSLPAHFNSNQHHLIKDLLPDSVKDVAITRAQLFEDENVLTSIVFYGGDDQIPLIFTADKNGKDIDQLPLFDSVGESFLSNSAEDVTILSNHTIVSIDSTSAIKVDERGAEIPNSRKLTITTKKFRVNASGKFEQFDTSVTMF
jgi:hypothetical protein